MASKKEMYDAGLHTVYNWVYSLHPSKLTESWLDGQRRNCVQTATSAEVMNDAYVQAQIDAWNRLCQQFSLYNDRDETASRIQKILKEELERIGEVP